MDACAATLEFALVARLSLSARKLGAEASSDRRSALSGNHGRKGWRRAARVRLSLEGAMRLMDLRPLLATMASVGLSLVATSVLAQQSGRHAGADAAATAARAASGVARSRDFGRHARDADHQRPIAAAMFARTGRNWSGPLRQLRVEQSRSAAVSRTRRHQEQQRRHRRVYERRRRQSDAVSARLPAQQSGLRPRRTRNRSGSSLGIRSHITSSCARRVGRRTA